MRLGIDLGGTKTEVAVLDPQGRMLMRRRRPTPVQAGYGAIVDNILDLVNEVEREVGPCTVGIGTPGTLSRSRVLKNSNTTCLNGRALDQDLAQRLGRPVRIANDANCFALSEARDGAGAGRGVVFGVILGTGVGGGIVVHGQLLSGLQSIAGEWGHNTLEPHGPPCYCGRRGCVETLLSGPGLAADYVRHGGLAALKTTEITARAAAGDDLAIAAIARYMERFGQALAPVINILDPDIVVLGGGLSHLEGLYSAGRAALARHVFNEELLTEIVPNAHGDSSGVRGAACLWPAD